LIAWLAAVIVAAPPAAAVAGPDGFDHQLHEGRVVAAAGEPPPCERCHPVDGRGRPMTAPGHGACFGGACHGEHPSAAKKASGPVCRACHTQAVPGPGARAFYPPFDVAVDYGVVFPHDRHAAAGGCEGCHRAPGASQLLRSGVRPGTKGAAHGRCVGCHAAPARPAIAPMTRCTACHASIAGRVTTPHQVNGPYRVGALFSHSKHAARLGRLPAAARCLVCHEAASRAAGDEVPAPSMHTCEACHDGKQAFAARGPTCRRCHTEADRSVASPEVPLHRFDHRAHAARGLAKECGVCHGLDDKGLPRPASADHRPCADVGCHADDFRARQPRICGGCHVGAEPYRPLRADVPRPARTEFGVEYSHAGHAGRGEPRPCTSCHVGLAGGGPELRLGKGHASCTGQGCHNAGKGVTGAAPTLDACASCHVSGLLPGREALQERRAWSVTSRFHHARHQRDAAGAALPCEACHTDAPAAKTVREISPPTKPRCAPCHDGRVAFKMTGHGCARCHGKSSGALP